MGSWHIRSAEYEKTPRPASASIEAQKRIRNPLSLKLISALTIIRESNIDSSLNIPEELVIYLQFINRNFHLTDRGHYMQYDILNDAILNNMHNVIPDVIEWGRHIGDTTFLNNSNLPEKRTPLLFAIEKEDVRLAHALLAGGANPNTSCLVTSQFPLMLAARKGNIALVKLLLSYKADIEQKEKIDGATALIDTAARGHKKMVEVLLQHKANVNITNNRRVTAAQIAQGNGHIEVHKLLKEFSSTQLNP